MCLYIHRRNSRQILRSTINVDQGTSSDQRIGMARLHACRTTCQMSTSMVFQHGQYVFYMFDLIIAKSKLCRYMFGKCCRDSRELMGSGPSLTCEYCQWERRQDSTNDSSRKLLLFGYSNDTTLFELMIKCMNE